MKKNAKSFILILVIFAIFTFASIKTIRYFKNDTFSKYYSYSSAQTNIDVAVPIFSSTIETIEVPLDEMQPGDTIGDGNSGTSYSFSILNFNNLNKVTDTSLNYTLTLETTGYLPIEYEIQKETAVGVWTPIVLTNNISPTYVLPHAIATTHNYRLVISWNSEYNSYEYSNLVEIVTIVINAEQKMS